MTSALQRQEHYWNGERLVTYENTRAATDAQWKLKWQPRRLVAVIYEDGENPILRKGPAATQARLSHAILRFERLSANATASDFSVNVPKELLTTISAKVTEA